MFKHGLHLTSPEQGNVPRRLYPRIIKRHNAFYCLTAFKSLLYLFRYTSRTWKTLRSQTRASRCSAFLEGFLSQAHAFFEGMDFCVFVVKSDLTFVLGFQSWIFWVRVHLFAVWTVSGCFRVLILLGGILIYQWVHGNQKFACCLLWKQKANRSWQQNASCVRSE